MTSQEGEEQGRGVDPSPDVPDLGDPEPRAAGRYDVEPAEAQHDGAAPEDPGYQRFDCTTTDPAALAPAVEAARAAIERGECIVLPTDTVYGIGADAFSADAVQRLLDAKIRGRDMPPPVLVADPSLIRVLAVDVPQQAKDLVERHWPGPLTVICKAQPSLRLDLGEAEGTIALRVPDHALAREVLRGTGPMAVSSANISGIPAALSCDEAVDQLGDRVAVYLDGGRVGPGDGASSTIVDFSQSDAGQVLRHGALSVDVLRETLPDLEDLVEPEPSEETLEDEDLPEPDEDSEPDDHSEPNDHFEPDGDSERDDAAGRDASESDDSGPGDASRPEPETPGGSHAVDLSPPEPGADDRPTHGQAAPRRHPDPEA